MENVNGVSQEDCFIPLVRLKLEKVGNMSCSIKKVTNPVEAAEIISLLVKGLPREAMIVVSLDSAGHPAAIEMVSMGSVNRTIAEPAELFKHAILSNACSIICGHNHPSGDLTPSYDDIMVTKAMVQAGVLLHIRVSDHIIVNSGGDDYFSFKESGYIEDFEKTFQPVGSLYA